MKYKKHLTRKEQVDAIEAWTKNLCSMADLAKKHDMTRQGIYKMLRGAGLDTTRKRLPVSCNACGKEVMRTKKRLRTQKHIFCSVDCYRAWFQSISQYDRNGYGSQVAREKVKQHFDLQPGNIVHHINGHGLDNALENLEVLRNQGDHLRRHRGYDVTPIWEGKKVM